MALAQAQLIASAQSPVFVANGENAVTCVIFCNTSLTIDATISCWVTPGAVAVGPSNMILNEISLPAGETFSMDTERFILSNGDSVQAQASQNTIVTCTVSYVQTG
jgi:hypothetical protein